MIIPLTKVKPFAYPTPTERTRPLPKAEDVTIVAGFNFDQGILICGDTKHTSTTVQHRPKIHTKAYSSEAKSVFALAGRSSVARMAIAECEKAIALKSSPTLQEMEDEIVDVLIQIHKKHVFGHPRKGYLDGPDFNLLVGLWSPHDGAKLYMTEETALDHVPGFHCWGSGEYLCRYIVEPRYASPRQPLKDVIFTAITALTRIKRFDPDCGGRSNFLVLRKDGSMKYESDFDVSQGEKFADTFYHYANAVYTMIADHPLDQVSIKKHLEWFLEDVNVARTHLQNEKDRREALIRSLSVVYSDEGEKAAGK